MSIEHNYYLLDDLTGSLCHSLLLVGHFRAGAKKKERVGQEGYINVEGGGSEKAIACQERFT
jgi:hypothetical protein